MSSVKDYFSSLGSGILSLVKGMSVTGKEFITPKITEKYPENRETHEWPERFRAVLELIYDENGNHKCIGCGICAKNCESGAITIVDNHAVIDTEKCIGCGACKEKCPKNAIVIFEEPKIQVAKKAVRH